MAFFPGPLLSGSDCCVPQRFHRKHHSIYICDYSAKQGSSKSCDMRYKELYNVSLFACSKFTGIARQFRHLPSGACTSHPLHSEISEINGETYVFRVPEVISSVTKITVFLSLFGCLTSQESWNFTIFGC